MKSDWIWDDVSGPFNTSGYWTSHKNLSVSRTCSTEPAASSRQTAAAHGVNLPEPAACVGWWGDAQVPGGFQNKGTSLTWLDGWRLCFFETKTVSQLKTFGKINTVLIKGFLWQCECFLLSREEEELGRDQWYWSHWYWLRSTWTLCGFIAACGEKKLIFSFLCAAETCLSESICGLKQLICGLFLPLYIWCNWRRWCGGYFYCPISVTSSCGEHCWWPAGGDRMPQPRSAGG